MHINTTTFSGIIIPLITPFYNNAVDIDSLKKLADYYVENRADGFVIFGTTGESATLTQEEKKIILTFIIKNYGDKLPIIAGISSNNTKAAVHEAKTLQDAGADGLLVLSPPYLKPSQAGIFEHYRHIAESISIPMIIYNIPHRTGVNIEFETIKKLAALPNIIGIKESAGDAMQLTNLILNTPLRVFTGEDQLLFLTCALGGHGAISAAAHIALPEMKSLLQDIEAGHLSHARKTFKKLLPRIKLCFSEPNPAPVKAILAHQGLIRSDEVRLPLIKASESVIKNYT